MLCYFNGSALCPWRIEVADPNPGERTLFLHVFEIADETNHQPAEVTSTSPAGVEINHHWRVEFNPAGPLGGAVDGHSLATTIQVDAQYPGQ